MSCKISTSLILGCLFFRVSASHPLISCIPPPPPGYTETVFADEFFLGHLDTNIWHYDLGTSYPGGAEHWGTGEVQTYTSSAENIKINAEGNLQITPRKKSNGTWTSSRIETKAGYDIACPDNGKLYVEAKIKIGSPDGVLPEDKQMGIWPAFWMLGAGFRGVWTNWPHVGEIDILETANGRGSVWNTIHCGTVYYGGPCNEPTGIGSQPSPFARGVWHTIGFEIDRAVGGGLGVGIEYPQGNITEPWRREKLRWFVDGVETFRVTPENLGYNRTAWKSLAVDSKFILLNVAVGGGFANGIAGGKSLPDNSTVGGEEVDMEVNYVAAWTSQVSIGEINVGA